ncbi:hypothetical protein [Psychromonas sp. B3M02]|uniref:hypothetical protein n=1 Tax=Psychromonas sp. B3M02 TaxID=2267226 RepID=UPI0011BED031|nr:hypothetical protein [Psychromonas sp. B3M02]
MKITKTHGFNFNFSAKTTQCCMSIAVRLLCCEKVKSIFIKPASDGGFFRIYAGGYDART